MTTQLLRTLSILTLALPGLTQTPLATFEGTQAFIRLGEAVGTADLNGDGFADVIAGTPFANPSSDRQLFYLGAVQAFSGLDGSLLFSFPGDQIEDFVGFAVDGAGDADGDGFDDLVVGAPGDALGSEKTGVVRVFSGQTGALVFAVGGAHGDTLGEAVAAAGDVNADGFDDVIAGAPRAADLVGRALVFSGFDGALLLELEGAGPDDFFGRAVSGAGDVDGDGFADLIASAPANSLGSGYARVYSGQNGALLHDILGDPQAVGGAGDVNQDGHDDFIVGEPLRFPVGRVRVYSGLDGSTLHTFEAPFAFAQFGSVVEGVGDVDGDGTPDILVGARGLTVGTPAGFARVYSGSDGRLLHHFQGGASEFFGAAVAGGDVDGDGFVDLVVGAPLIDGIGINTGVVFVFPGSEQLGTTFCTSLSNSSGAVASLSARGSHASTPLNVRFEIEDLPASTQGLVFFGPSQLAGAPFGDGLRCVGGTVQRVLPPVAGMGHAQVTLDGSAAYAGALAPGASLNFQFWFRDAMAMMSGFNTSTARSVTFQ